MLPGYITHDLVNVSALLHQMSYRNASIIILNSVQENLKADQSVHEETEAVAQRVPY